MSINVDGSCNLSSALTTSGAPFGSSGVCCNECASGQPCAGDICETTPKTKFCMDTIIVHFDQFATGTTNPLLNTLTIAVLDDTQPKT